jgi:hypothetical protein
MYGSRTTSSRPLGERSRLRNSHDMRANAGTTRAIRCDPAAASGKLAADFVGRTRCFGSREPSTWTAGCRPDLLHSDGRMSAQLMRPGSNRFASEDWRKAAPLEKSIAWSDYFGYFGTFSIDLEKKAVVHHIQGSWFPNLIGTDQIRYFRYQDDRLILDADTEWGRVHIVWRKLATR